MIKLTTIALIALAAPAVSVADNSQPHPAATGMEMPKPAQQIADRLKAMAGNWKCVGTAAGMDGKDQPFTGTMTSKSDLDGFWVHESFSGITGGKSPMKYTFENFATFDGNLKKWREIMVDNWGGQMIGTGDEMSKDGKLDIASDAIDMMGKGTTKAHVDASDMKKGVHMWGEYSRDGKTWTKSYDMLCKH